MSRIQERSLPAQTRRIGRVLRFISGIAVLALVVPAYLRVPLTWIGGALGVFVGLLGFYLVLHLLVMRYFGRLNPWVGAVLANIPVLVLFIFGGPVVQIGAGTYLGTALVLAGIRADSGCEVMSIPGLLLGRQTHLACLVFSPVDWAESKVSERSK